MRLPVLTLRFAALALFAVIAGCATPQYQTTVRLVPPADAQGRACAEDCEAKKTVCQGNCQTRYQACVKALEPQVEARYIEALQRYELNLRHYAAELRHYQLQLHFGWRSSYPYYYPYHYPYWWDPWPRPYFPPPYPPPSMPTREGVRAQLAKSNCQEDCGCLPAYDTCFVGCGGQLVRETVCIKNCPPGK